MSTPFVDQMLAAYKEAGGYSKMASSFHPVLRERVSSLVHAPRELPDLDLYAEQLSDALDPVYRELQVRASVDSPAPYIVWAQFPELNWPVPVCMDIPTVARLLLLRWTGRCDWCERGTEPTSGLLCSAPMAVCLFSFCEFCRLTLSDACRADLYWIDCGDG